MADNQQRTTSVLPSVERIQQELARANSIDDDAHHVANPMAESLDVNRLKIGRAPDQLAPMPALLLDKNIHGPPDAAIVEFPLLPRKQLLQPRKP